MAAPRVLAIVLAGGEGKRLMPLTAHRAKPAVPFGGGIYRLIDFALSNVINSRYLHVIVLTQYKSHSLDRHVSKTWRMSPLLGNYVAAVPAQQRVGKHWYLAAPTPSTSVSTSSRTSAPPTSSSWSARTTSTVWTSPRWSTRTSRPAPSSRSRPSGSRSRRPTSSASSRPTRRTPPGSRRSARSRPTPPWAWPTPPGEILASMGNYVADADALVKAVTADAENPDSRHDMGGDIAPYFVERGTAGVYDFLRNDVAGSTPPRDRDYWRDVGTIDAYYEANIDLISIEPVFNLYNHEWPLYTGYVGLPPAKFVHAGAGRLGHAADSIVSPRRPRVRGGHRVRLGALAAHQGALVGADHGLRDHGRRRDQPVRADPPGHPRQERDRPGARPDRPGPRARPRTRVHGDRVRHHRRPPKGTIITD